MSLRNVAVLFLSLTTLLPRAYGLGEEPTGNILSFGIYSRTALEKTLISPQTPSGLTKLGQGLPKLLEQTNGIPARFGTCFGFVYDISNLNTTNGAFLDIIKTVKHPEIKKPDGSVSHGFIFVEKAVVENSHATNWTGYGFDHPYELVPGVWEIRIEFNGKLVAKKKFNVFEPQNPTK